jgi:hypothetical protein
VGVPRPWTSHDSAALTTSGASTTTAGSAPATTRVRTTSPHASPPVTTSAEAIAALRAAISTAVNADNLDPKAADDLNNRLDDLSRSLTTTAKPGKGNKRRADDAGRIVADLNTRLADLAKKRSTHPRRPATAGRAARRTRTPRTTSPMKPFIRRGHRRMVRRATALASTSYRRIGHQIELDADLPTEHEARRNRQQVSNRRRIPRRAHG